MYEPAVLSRLNKNYQLLHNWGESLGINVWYGDAGDDVELAKLILDGATLAELKQYLTDNYFEDEESAE
jgi:hypothetical protein